MDFIQYDEEQEKNRERTKVYFECVEKAIEITHTVIHVRAQVREIEEIQKSNDKLLMWNTLQKYLTNYRNEINSYSMFTNLVVYNVGADFYDNVSIDEIRLQFDYIKGFISLINITRTAHKETFKKCLESLLKKTGMFDGYL